MMLAGRLTRSPGRRCVLGWGAAYPGPAITTAALCQQIEAQFDIPLQRYARLLSRKLQVHTRHLCRDFVAAQETPRSGARNPELAAQALVAALHKAQLSSNDIAYLISHTTTPAQLLPAGSAEISRLIGYQGAHMELRQACTGFANALQIAFAMTQHADDAPVAIVGVETGSVFFDPQQLRGHSAQWVNFLQMGDGAGAVVIGPDRGQTGQVMIESAYFGQCQQPPSPGLCLPTGGSDQPYAKAGAILFEHDYNSVMEEGLSLLTLGREALAAAGQPLADAAWVVPHQASGALAPWLAQHWQLDLERISTHGQRVGNLGSASIWAALDELLQKRDQWPGQSALFLGAEATQYSYGGFAIKNF